MSSGFEESFEFRPNSEGFVVNGHHPIHLHNLSEQNNQVVVLYTLDDQHQADLALANVSELNSDSEVDEEDNDDDKSDGAEKLLNY